MAAICRISYILIKIVGLRSQPPCQNRGFFHVGIRFGLIEFINKRVGFFHYRCYFVRDMKETLFTRAEDDLDFMPIIPLNETDNDGLNDIEIPKELPVLPLRNTVLFPGVVLPITVG